MRITPVALWVSVILVFVFRICFEFGTFSKLYSFTFPYLSPVIVSFHENLRVRLPCNIICSLSFVSLFFSSLLLF